MILVFTVIFVALIFTYTNGFHDTANAIATVVGTKVLTPRQAILLATVTNLLGAMTGAAVAKTIASGLVDTGLFRPTSLRPCSSARCSRRYSGICSPGISACRPVPATRSSADSAARPSRRRTATGAPSSGAKCRRPASIGGPAAAFFSRWSSRCSSRRCWDLPLPSSSWPRFTCCCRAPSAHRHADIRAAAIVQFRLHGFQPRHQRRAKNHGHHLSCTRRRNRWWQL